MSESRRPAFAKNVTRAATGGIAAVIAVLLLMFMNGFGSGDGDSESEDGGDNLMVSTDTQTDGDDEQQDGEGADTEGLTEAEQQALKDGVLGILIDETDYFLILPGKEPIYRPSDLDELVRLAMHAKGDSNGIRVKILRRESSRTLAEIELQQALTDAGIKQDAVYMPREPLPVQ